MESVTGCLAEDVDETAGRKVLFGGISRRAAEDYFWGERLIAWLIDLLRFFLEEPDERWWPMAPPRQ